MLIYNVLDCVRLLVFDMHPGLLNKIRFARRSSANEERNQQFGAASATTGPGNWSDYPMKEPRLSTQKWKGIRRTLLCLAIPVLLATASFAAPQKVAHDIDRHNPNALVDVIVQFKVTPNASHYQKMSARGAVLRT